RTTLPVLSNVLLATDEGRLRLSATNLEMGITCWVGGKIEEEGSITIPARTLTDLVNTLPSENLFLVLNPRTQSLEIKCSTTSSEIKGIDAQEFPPMPTADPGTGIELNVADLKEMIQQVVFAASLDEARPVLMGAQLNITENQITMAAADGFRISVKTASLSASVAEPLSIIVPAKALSELARIAMDGDQKVKMTIPSARGQVIFSLKDVEIASQLIEGKFPDFNQIIPKTNKTRTVLTTASFLKACKQVEVFAREGSNVARLNLKPSGDDGISAVEINAANEETGSSDVVLDATIEGIPLLVAFNVRFLREALEVIKSPNVALETTAANTPGTIKPVGDESFIHVIMPMHL
ncbi:MAG: DNA polymerase III subunit beta, partial [Anaerolinea sp.]|nr:DNA polymerase III subunit beta [Anaerolinea sp.]